MVTKRGSRDKLTGIRSELSGGARFLSDAESAHYACTAQEHIAHIRPDIDPAELLPIRAVELDNDEKLLEYGRHYGDIPMYRGPHLFVRMNSSGELLDLQTDWAPCRFELGVGSSPPEAIRPPTDSSCLRGTYALDVSAELPFYFFPPRVYDKLGHPIHREQKLGPWEWIDLRGAAPAKRGASDPIRPLRGHLPAADTRKPEPLNRDELRKARSAVLDYLVRNNRPSTYRWAFLAGRERSSFSASSGGFVHVRVYRTVHGLPVLGACLDLYVERQSGRLAAVSDELHFRRMNPNHFAQALLPPKLSQTEAWEKLHSKIKVLPFHLLNDSDSEGIGQVSLVWIEESGFVCDSSSGSLVQAEIVRL